MFHILGCALQLDLDILNVCKKGSTVTKSDSNL